MFDTEYNTCWCRREAQDCPMHQFNPIKVLKDCCTTISSQTVVKNCVEAGKLLMVLLFHYKYLRSDVISQKQTFIKVGFNLHLEVCILLFAI